MLKTIKLITLTIIVAGVVVTGGMYIRGQRLMHQQSYRQIEATQQAQQDQQELQAQEKFIKMVADPAVKLYESKPQVLPSIVIAQAILESNWGKSELYKQAYNPFGIKGKYHGKYVRFETKEYINHKNVTIMDNFRKYPSLLEAIADHDTLLSNNFIKSSNDQSYLSQAKLLKENGYATDKDYDEKLIKLIKTYKLSKYDLQAINQE